MSFRRFDSTATKPAPSPSAAAQQRLEAYNKDLLEQAERERQPWSKRRAKSRNRRPSYVTPAGLLEAPIIPDMVPAKRRSSLPLAAQNAAAVAAANLDSDPGLGAQRRSTRGRPPSPLQPRPPRQAARRAPPPNARSVHRASRSGSGDAEAANITPLAPAWAPPESQLVRPAPDNPPPSFAFPSQKPASRADAVFLTNVLDDMLGDLRSTFDPESSEGQPPLDRPRAAPVRIAVVDDGTEVAGFHPSVQAELSMWSMVTAELVRQVWLHCEERGMLLDRARLRLLSMCRHAHDWCRVQTAARYAAEERMQRELAEVRARLDSELKVLAKAYQDMTTRADAYDRAREGLTARCVLLVSPAGVSCRY